MWPFPDRTISKPEPASKTDVDSGTTVRLNELIHARHAITALGMGAKKGVHSLLAGGERSPFKGRGVDFDEVRRYQSGDDVRYMDWRVTARSGEPHLKIFREERERPVFVVVDYSHSMLFGTKVAFKSVVAAKAASLLCWASLHRGDRIGTVVFSNHGHEERRPRGGKSGVLRVLDVLARHHQQARQSQFFIEEHSRASFVSALARVTRTARPGSLIFLLSDFRNMGPQVLPYLTQLSIHHDVVNVLIFDQLERELPVAGVYRVTNGSDFGVFDSRSLPLVQEYRRQFSERRQFVEHLCRQHGMGFFSIGTHEPIAETVLQGLRIIGARRKHVPVGNAH
ncbi:DUF58 domain-containing protein [Candidatus Nitrospira salsa]|nr:MAG: hypothetical protein NPIRA04_14950 [Nitrospirales bacterium]